ncbi:MAG: sugar transferase [Acidimicrobiales bacterium]|nr:sugar transferase [Acidimicrobiales bacterium]
MEASLHQAGRVRTRHTGGAPVRWGPSGRLLAVDLASLAAGWSAGSTIAGGGTRLVALSTGIGAVAVGVAAAVVCFALAGMYRSPLIGARSGALGRLVQSMGLSAVAVIVWQGATGDVAPRQALGGVAGALVVTTVARCAFDVWLISRRERGEYRTPVVVAGVADETARLVELLGLNPEAGLLPAAIVGERPAPGGDAHPTPPWMGDLDDTCDAVRRVGASGVLVGVNGLPSATVGRLVDGVSTAGIPVHLSSGLTGVSRARLRMAAVAHAPITQVSPPRHTPVQAIAKRSLDIVMASLLLVAGATVILVAAAMIKAHDGGRVLFRQERVGRDGRPFMLVKLRTMVVEAEARLDDLRDRNERDGPLFKVSDDPRITPIGGFLRSTAIDELPQLVNVLAGHMSIVGPRPALPAEAAEFDDELQRRHCVRPGVTGLWQVEASHKASFDEYRRLDLLYIDNWSLGTDVAVIVDTVQAISRRVVRALHRPAPTAPAPAGLPPAREPVEIGS